MPVINPSPAQMMHAICIHAAENIIINSSSSSSLSAHSTFARHLLRECNIRPGCMNMQVMEFDSKDDSKARLLEQRCTAFCLRCTVQLEEVDVVFHIFLRLFLLLL